MTEDDAINLEERQDKRTLFAAMAASGLLASGTDIPNDALAKDAFDVAEELVKKDEQLRKDENATE